MTRDRDIERVLDRFYADGPTEMPDRVLLAAFDRIERVPQRRLALHLTRFATMNSNLRLAAAAAIVVAVVGVGAFALSQRTDVGPPASPSPSLPAASDPGTFAPASLPAALQSSWVGAPRVVPAAVEPPFRTSLTITNGDLQFETTGEAKEFASVANLIGPDLVRLRLGGATANCSGGDEGTYTFALSANDTVLTLTPVADQCQARAAALAGDWNRAACPDTNSPCLGKLEPGSHVSTIFTPFTPLATWSYAYGRFAYTTPAGWANTEDCPWCYTLAEQGAPENTNINLWTDAVAHAQADQCSGGAEPGIGRTADEIVAWLTTLPGLVTTVAAPIAVGGLNGKVVDLSVAPTWTKTCQYAYSPGLPLVSTFFGGTAGNDFDWNIQGEGRTRVIALDLGDGRAMVIDIEAQNQADFDALLPDAMQLISTFSFNH